MSDFEKAVAYIRGLPKDGPVQPSNEQRLEFYGLFKQATEGDCNIAQPWAVQLEARAKWDSWNSRKGMAKEECEKAYVATLDAFSDAGDWRSA